MWSTAWPKRLARSVAHFALDFAGSPFADQVGNFSQQSRDILRLYERPNLRLAAWYCCGLAFWYVVTIAVAGL